MQKTMTGKDISPLEASISAFDFLVGRLRVRLNDADHRLLAASIGSDTRWRGGIRSDSVGTLGLIDAPITDRLSPDQAARAGYLLATAYLGFYNAAADGVALTDVRQVKAVYGESVAESYPEAGQAFLKFATTYWTMKVLSSRLDVCESTTVVRALLVRMDELLGPLFFPYHGPFLADPSQREVDQRRFICTFGPRIPIEDFIENNPILIRDRQTLGNRRRR